VQSLLINAPEPSAAQGIEHKVSRDGGRRRAAGGDDRGHERLGFDITHVYGLTEVYGPAASAPSTRGTACPSASARG
jgi:fatty-acyl-CoA synthase